MERSNLYGPSNQSTLAEISEYVDNELWQDLNSFVQITSQDLIMKTMRLVSYFLHFKLPCITGKLFYTNYAKKTTNFDINEI